MRKFWGYLLGALLVLPLLLIIPSCKTADEGEEREATEENEEVQLW